MGPEVMGTVPPGQSLGRVLLEEFEGDNLESLVAGCRQHDPGGTARLESLQPTGRTEAPAIPRYKPRETVFRPRCYQVIASLYGERKKRLSHHCTDRMRTGVLSAGATEAVSKEAGQGGG